MKPKIALVHDYLVDFGGAERVLLALHEIWPEAPLFVSITDPKKMGPRWSSFADWDIRTSWFQKIPGASRLISPLRFLLPLIWESFDFSEFDLVISSSAWGMAKAIVTSPRTPHVCYCHTPPRFLYSYPGARKWTRYWPVRIYSQIINHQLRLYDFATSKRVDHFIANSQEVSKRIAKFYRRSATVINPPVDIPSRLPAGKKSRSAPFLCVGRLVDYKHPDWAVVACAKLKKPLVVIGDGPLRPLIEKLAVPHPFIKVLGRVSDQELKKWYQRCRAVIFPVEKEDFGIVPLEGQGYGKPIIALWSGGAKETIREGKTGIFFNQPSAKGLMSALQKFEKEEKNFDPQAIYRWSKQFSKENFKKKIKKFIGEKLNA